MDEANQTPQSSWWSELAAADPSLLTIDYARRYYASAKEASADGRANDAAIARLLADLCSYTLRLDRKPPFAPWPSMPTGEGNASPDQLSKGDLGLLGELWPEASDAALRARLCDVAWEYGRDFKAARAAVDAYLELAAGLMTNGSNAPKYAVMLERAVQVAASLGQNNNVARQQVRQALDSHIASAGLIETGFLMRDLVRMALRHGDDGKTHIAAAAEIAKRSEAASDWHRAREYWMLVEECAGSDLDARRAATRAIAECYVTEAAAVAKQPHLGSIVASSHIASAIEALRRGGGERERVNELRVLLAQYQSGITAGLIPISTTFEIGQYVDQAEAAVSGKGFREALQAIGNLASPLNVATSRVRAEDHAKRYIGASLFPAVYHGEDGQVIARPGSPTSNDPEEREAALRASMIHAAAMEIAVLGNPIINRARLQLLFEHPAREDDFLSLLRYNPLIPEGREGLWAEGLYAGLVGDMTKAVHILIPQIEHAVRRLAQRLGIPISTLEPSGRQMMLGLNRLLLEPLLQQSLGDDMTFTLQALLVEQVGPNLRHRMAHGLLSSSQCYSGSVVYLWAFAVRFCCLHLGNTPTTDIA